MIVGNGMMARAFSMYGVNRTVLIFASGVSNSSEADQSPFKREESLLRKALHEHADKLFVYFGTCSVDDPDMMKSSYVLHKLNMERMISDNHSRYIIFRLPQVVGQSANRTTLVNYFYDMVVRGEHFTVWKNATRYLIDVEDVSLIAGHIIDNGLLCNCILNIAGRRYSVIEIIHLLEQLVGVKGNYTVVDRGVPFSIDNSLAARVADELNIAFSYDYLRNVLSKYYTQVNTGR